MSIFNELKRRNVIRVAIAYAVVSWVLIQIGNILFSTLELGSEPGKILLAILLLGFIPAVIFAWAFEITPEGIKHEKDIQRDDSITNITAKRLDIATIALLVVAIGLFGMDKLVHEADSTPSVFPAAAGTHDGESKEIDPRTESSSAQSLREEDKTFVETQANPVNDKSIAVLPFVNMSSDAEQEYFSDGITEEILNALAKVKQLKVAGRTSSFAFKGRNEDLRLIGDTLGVAHILEGSVRKAGAKIRITAQLIKVEDGFHMWSETYDRELTDVFAIQDEIANAILSELKTKLLESEVASLTATQTDPEVYDLYLLGKQRMYGRTRATLESALELFDQAITKDSNYAPAYAQRGIATFLLSDTAYGLMPQDEASAIGREFIDKSLVLDPQLAEGWAGMGFDIYWRPGQTKEGIAALEKALSINPNLINASNWLSGALNLSGEPRRALSILQTMMDKDPLYRPGYMNAVISYNMFGHEADALALIAKVKMLRPDDSIIVVSEAITHAYNGRTAQALSLLEGAVQQAPTNRGLRVGWYAVLLQSQQFERLLKESLPNSGSRVTALFLLGKTEEATVLAKQLADSDNIEPLFWLYNNTGRSDLLITYLEQKWPDLNAFQSDYPPNRDGYDLMAEIAHAYARSNNQPRFADALSRLEVAIKHLDQQGINNPRFEQGRAIYLALAGDTDGAIASLSKAVDMGLRDVVPMSRTNSAFESIADDPRYVGIEQRMLAHINSEREQLGLEPVKL